MKGSTRGSVSYLKSRCLEVKEWRLEHPKAAFKEIEEAIGSHSNFVT